MEGSVREGEPWLSVLTDRQAGRQAGRRVRKEVEGQEQIEKGGGGSRGRVRRER
jgi:hypothetical protein